MLAPTGTISFMMDCDTTGVEPDFSLVKSKKLVGGGEITIVNRTVPLGLEKLGYAPDEVDEVVAFIDERNTVVGAPFVKAEHYPVFDCAVGERAIHYAGHVKMMGAIQPFISRRDLEDREPARDGDRRRGRAALARRVEARRQGDRDLPRQLQGRAAALGQEGGGRRAAGAAARAQAPAGGPHRGRPQVPRRRVRGLHPRRPLRRRHARRHLRRHRQGGHDARRPDELVHDLRLARPPVRRAARGVRLEVRAHALRAERDDERPGHPRRQVDRRLRLPLDGQEVPHGRAAGGDRDPLARGARADGVGIRRRGRAGGGRRRSRRRRPARRRCSTAGRTPSSAPAAAAA